MLQSTDLQSNLEELVRRYFHCWRHHDTFELRHIFTDDAIYKIGGKDPLIGLTQIGQYWRRNELRQTKLQIDYNVQAVGDDSRQANFLATFFDTEEKEEQSIGGYITFTFNPEQGKIQSLSEQYLKITRHPHGLALYVMYIRRLRASRPIRYVIRNVRRIVFKMLRSVNSATKGLASWAIGFGYLIFVALAAILILLAIYPAPFGDLAVIIFKHTELYGNQDQITSALRSTALQRAIEVFGGLLAVFATIVGIMIPEIQRRLERQRLRREAGLLVIDLPEGEGKDLEIMTATFRDAERITVFAGDFSFLCESDKLRSTFSRLNMEGKITLVSSRPESDVRRELEKQEATENLLNALKENENFLFSSGLEIKCSLVESHKLHQFLYKYKGFGVADKMCILRGTNDMHYLVEALHLLVKRVIFQLRA